jgi:hypothetical protein
MKVSKTAEGFFYSLNPENPSRSWSVFLPTLEAGEARTHGSRIQTRIQLLRAISRCPERAGLGIVA